MGGWKGRGVYEEGIREMSTGREGDRSLQGGKGR